jgi:hypothetical protein
MEPETTAEQHRHGIAFFDAATVAPLLYRTGMMSMPTVDPPAPEHMTEWSLAGGHDVRVLFRQGGDAGLSLVWSRFGPNYPLPRHSHSADCLYYVVAGEARLGNRRVGAGEGFFVPANAPYAYTAGAEGIEILEFRAADAFDMRITETLPRWDGIVESVRAHKDAWANYSPSES